MLGGAYLPTERLFATRALFRSRRLLILLKSLANIKTRMPETMGLTNALTTRARSTASLPSHVVLANIYRKYDEWSTRDRLAC